MIIPCGAAVYALPLELRVGSRSGFDLDDMNIFATGTRRRSRYSHPNPNPNPNPDRGIPYWVRVDGLELGGPTPRRSDHHTSPRGRAIVTHHPQTM